MPTRGRGPAKSCGGGSAGCRCNIDETAVCFVLTRVLCVLFFFLRPVSEKRRRRAVGSGATHAYISLHRKARPTHTLPIAPRWRGLTAIEAAAKAGKVMRRRVSRVQTEHRTAVCFVDYCSMLTRVLCMLFFFCTPHAHRTTHHARTAHRPTSGLY